MLFAWKSEPSVDKMMVRHQSETHSSRCAATIFIVSHKWIIWESQTIDGKTIYLGCYSRVEWYNFIFLPSPFIWQALHLVIHTLSFPATTVPRVWACFCFFSFGLIMEMWMLACEHTTFLLHYARDRCVHYTNITRTRNGITTVNRECHINSTMAHFIHKNDHYLRGSSCAYRQSIEGKIVDFVKQEQTVISREGGGRRP